MNLLLNPNSTKLDCTIGGLGMFGKVLSVSGWQTTSAVSLLLATYVHH